MLDLWFERVVKGRLRGEAQLVRYIDDFVICFQYRSDAIRVQDALRLRLGKFGLTLEPTKTKLVEFGRFAQKHAGKRGRNRPETIYFLGLTLYCTRNQKANFKVGTTSRLYHGRRHRHSSARSAVPPAPENRYTLRCIGVVPDSDTRSRLTQVAPIVTSLKVPFPNQNRCSASQARAPAFESCSTRRVAASDVVRVHRMLPDRPDFEPCCPVLWRYLGEARPVAATIEVGRIDGRAKIKIEVSA